MTIQTGSQVAFAFGLTIAAGFATCLGGCMIFSNRLVYLASPQSLAIALGASSGVMLFISLSEIFGESVVNFEEGLSSSTKCDDTCKGHAWLLAACSFIFGWLLVYVLDYVIDKLSPGHDHDLQSIQRLRKSLHEEEEKVIPHPLHPVTGSGNGLDFIESQTPKVKKEANNQLLHQTGLLTALAIGIHNIPEGIATFAGAMDDSSFGIALCFGIALHNIPEGLAVAAPVYFSTGSRLKGFLWTLVSAFALPLGGVIAWLIMGDDRNKCVDGGLFGMICGVMICICIKELLPTALTHAPKGEIVTWSVLGGIMAMVISLMCFKYAGFD